MIERPLAREVLEQPADGPHRLLGRARAVADADRRGDLAAIRLRVRVAREQLLDARSGVSSAGRVRGRRRASGQYVIPSPYGRQRP